jgi:hypothetical protein
VLVGEFDLSERGLSVRDSRIALEKILHGYNEDFRYGGMDS